MFPCGDSLQKHLLDNELYKSLFNHHPNAIYVLDLNGTCIAANASTQVLTGFSDDELLNHHFNHFIAPDDIQRTSDYFQRTLAGKPQNYEIKIIHKNGKLIEVQVTNVPIVIHQQVIGLYAIAADITAKKQIEDQLRYSQEQLAHAQHIAKVGSWEIDESKGIHYWSNEVFHIFGLEPDPKGFVANETFLNCIHPDDLEKVKSSLNDDILADIEYRIIRPNGEERVIQSLRDVTYSELGKISRLRGTAQDVTELKSSERLLLESQQRFKSLINYNPIGICAVDLTGRIMEANPAYQKILGYSIDELVQMSTLDLLFPEDIEWALKTVSDSLSGNLHAGLQARLKHKNGYAIDVSCTQVPIIINNKAVGLYAIVQDITEKKQTEELMRNSEKLSVVGQLAAGIGHEIRNPLASIKGFVQLLQKRINEYPQYFEIILSELERINKIVSEFMILAKPQAVRYEPKNVVSILQEVLLLIESQAILSNTQIFTVVESDIPHIKCEENQIKQVFINILKNSLDAMPNGGKVFVTVKIQDLEQILIRITDEGCGIPENLLPKLGEPFYTTKETGTGLGLMVTRKIIENHNGKLLISSQVNVGTSIEVILPISI